MVIEDHVTERRFVSFKMHIHISRNYSKQQVRFCTEVRRILANARSLKYK